MIRWMKSHILYVVVAAAVVVSLGAALVLAPQLGPGVDRSLEGRAGQVGSLATSSTNPASLSGVVFGAHTLVNSGSDPASYAAVLDQAQAAGMNYARMDLSWRNLNPSPSSFLYNQADNLVAAANQRGLQPVAIVAYTPDWADRKSVV